MRRPDTHPGKVRKMDGQKPLSVRKPAIYNHTGAFRPVCQVSRPVAG